MLEGRDGSLLTSGSRWTEDGAWRLKGDEVRGVRCVGSRMGSRGGALMMLSFDVKMDGLSVV
jgi:hypothetical protein